MTIQAIIEHLNVGGVLSVFVILMALVEVTPIKISPLQWIGKRVNADTIARIDILDKKIETVDMDLKTHKAISSRTKILSFQDDLLAGKTKTQENFEEIIDAIDEYESFIEEHELKNGFGKNAIKYINNEYQKRLANNSFDNLPN